MRRSLPVLALLLSPWGMPAHADWPHVRGPNLDGRGAASARLARTDLALREAWRAAVGPGSSGIAVADGHVVTLFSDGSWDLVAAFDPASGAELWRRRVDRTRERRNGFDGGPLSSPVIDDGVVYGLGPRGRLFAMGLEDGESIWSKHLENDLGARPPSFGFASNPLVDGNLLIVQVGGSDGRAVCALDKTSGELRWCAGADSVSHQSPAIMTLAGRRQLVVVSDRRIHGIVPNTGQVLWEHEIGEAGPAYSTTPTFAGEDRFVVQSSGHATAFRIAPRTGGFRVEELYRTEALGNSSAAPVYHEGFLYGFRDQVLSCVEAATGRRVWRSRPPGGAGLILVGERLVVFGREGKVVVADASPEGYVERASIVALERSGSTWPSFSGDLIFVRNREELAAVALGRRVGREIPTELGADTEFGRFLAGLASAKDKTARIDDYLERHPGSPLAEGEYLHFIYRGATEDVAIEGSMLAVGEAEPMERVAGTDLFHKTFRLDPEVRWEYRFRVDYGDPVRDPRNPRSVPAVWDGYDFSEWVPAGAEPPSHLAEPAGDSPRGDVSRFAFRSAIFDGDKNMWVYLPPGYDESEARFPLLIVTDGHAWLEKGRMANTLDQRIGRTLAPVVVAFLWPEENWWIEAGGSRTGDTARMLAEEMVPRLARRYRLLDGAEHRALLGSGHYGLTAAYTALAFPTVFGKAAVQSADLGLGAEDELFDLLEGARGAGGIFYVDWNRYDSRSADGGSDSRRDSMRLAQVLREAGFVVEGGEFRDSYGWGAWRGRSDRVLESLFPRRDSDP